MNNLFIMPDIGPINGPFDPVATAIVFVLFLAGASYFLFEMTN